ncbi:UNVERIFIED_CONTAM: arylsulfatase [Mumia flava]
MPEYARGYERFPGRVGRTASQSERAWPRERRAADGSPNIVVVVVDDLGYSDVGPFGSEIATPVLDGLARRGIVLPNYHTTPVCSPARAALLTGLNPHRAGYGSVANSDPGFPNLRLELDDDVLTLPEALREHGYATFGIGKWHLTRDALMNHAADKGTWPLQRGFDRYYGTLEGCNSFFHPNQLIRDNGAVDVTELPPDYYLTDDLTDEAVAMIKGLRANDSRKPFFLYFAHHAMHGPLGAKPEDLAAQRGRYDDGWDAVRRRRHAAQIASGLLPTGTVLPDAEKSPGFDVAAWDSLSEAEQIRYARYMEVYAAMVASIDASLGRILDVVDALGELEDTIVVFTSDNGGTFEGGAEGTRSYFSRFVHVPGVPRDWEADVDRDLDLIGGPRTMVHYPRGWGMVSNTPFRFAKGQTFAGGVRVPMIVAYGDRLRAGHDDDGYRRGYQYVTDVLPTLLDLAGITHPGRRNGSPTQAIDGVSFAETLCTAGAGGTRHEQYAEFGGNRGYYADGWKVVTQHAPGTPFDDAEWELYHVESDPTEVRDLAADEPERLRAMALAWERAAWENTVFPLPDAPGLAAVRRPAERELEQPVTLLPGTPRLERYRSSVLTSLRSFAVEVDLATSGDDAGVLVAHGDQGGGYALIVEDDRLRLSYNEYGRLRRFDAGPIGAGDHLVRLEMDAWPGFKWGVRVLLDGRTVARGGPVWMLLGMAPFSGIDVGLDRPGPVDWDVYQRHGAYRWSGTLRTVRYLPGPRAGYDPAAVAEAERDVALAFD